MPSREDKFFLFVGSLEKRKNLTGLIRAFEMTGLVNEGYSLKIVGMDGNGAGDIREISRKVVGVELLGFVDEKTLMELYANCRAFVYLAFGKALECPYLRPWHMVVFAFQLNLELRLKLVGKRCCMLILVVLIRSQLVFLLLKE